MVPKVGLAQKRRQQDPGYGNEIPERNFRKNQKRQSQNSDIREQLKADDIKHDMGRNRPKWYGHVMRMADERIPKKMLEMKLRERRPRGRPRTTWMDQIKRDMEDR
jgi:hypothetical protein